MVVNSGRKSQYTSTRGRRSSRSIDENDGKTAGRIGISSRGAGSELVLRVHDTVSECHILTVQL